MIGYCQSYTCRGKQKQRVLADVRPKDDGSGELVDVLSCRSCFNGKADNSYFSGGKKNRIIMPNAESTARVKRNERLRKAGLGRKRGQVVYMESTLVRKTRSEGSIPSLPTIKGRKRG